ncbi:EamA family transporter [Paenibacillus rhizophilus]|uniref:EamA family transporter n=1 Tax=Paenibacillus rhizophilus TaxID=1850366 RepID=UPI0026CC36C8
MKYKAWILLILANLFWSGNMIFGKFSSIEFPAVWTAFLRWVVALILLIPIAQIIEKPSWLQIWKKTGYRINGEYNYLIKVQAASIEELAEFQDSLVKLGPSKSHISMKNILENRVLL